MKHEPIGDHAERKRILALIERCEKEQTMSRWIDAEWLLGVAELSNGTVDVDDIYNAPSIDAVSVVRCRECKHKYQEPWHDGVAVEGECEIWHNATLDDDYCSYGEKEGER